MTPPAPLAVELLVSEHHRRPFTTQPPAFDEIDELAAEPAVDRLPARRSESEQRRLLSILDELERERRSA
jgi:hypothetical protein